MVIRVSQHERYRVQSLLAELVCQSEGVSRPMDPQYQRHTEHTHASENLVLTTNALLEELIPGPFPWCAQAVFARPLFKYFVL